MTDVNMAYIRLRFYDRHLLFVRTTGWLPQMTSRDEKVPVYSDTLTTLVTALDVPSKS